MDTPHGADELPREDACSPFPRRHAAIAIVTRTNGVPIASLDRRVPSRDIATQCPAGQRMLLNAFVQHRQPNPQI
jgi:hypothetical protein